MGTTNIGKIIYGFCNGFFGRDDYEDKIILFETNTAIVCTYLEGNTIYGTAPGILTCANFDSEEEKQEYINKWSKGDD